MTGIAAFVQHLPGPAFAVDEHLRLVAWNRPAALGFGLDRALGQRARCHEVIRATEAETGDPCHLRCPLARPAADAGWGNSRLLLAAWHGSRGVPLDCLIIPCVARSGERAAVVSAVPPGAEDDARYRRALAALQSLYPTLASASDPEQLLRAAVRAALRAAAGEAAALALLDSAGRQVVRLEYEARDPAVPGEPWRWLGPEEVAALCARPDGALVTRCRPGAEPEGDAAGAGERSWWLTIPLLAGGRGVGALGLVGRAPRFDPGFAARVLLAVGAQLGAVPGWADAASWPAPTPEPFARFSCFGRFRVTIRGREVPTCRFKRRKAVTLLKVLAAHRGRPLDRGALAEILWPEADPALAASNLRVVLHDLRRGLGAALSSDQDESLLARTGSGIALDPSARCWVDVEEFERLTARFAALVDRGEFEAALAVGWAAADLVAGDFLDDEPDLDWCRAERQRLREAHLDLLQRLAALHAEQGQIEAAIRACRRALSADALRETAHRQLIRLLAAAGRRDEALRQCRECRRLLWEELQVEPDAATEAACRAIGQPTGQHHRR